MTQIQHLILNNLNKQLILIKLKKIYNYKDHNYLNIWIWQKLQAKFLRVYLLMLTTKSLQSMVQVGNNCKIRISLWIINRNEFIRFQLFYHSHSIFIPLNFLLILLLLIRILNPRIMDHSLSIYFSFPIFQFQAAPLPIVQLLSFNRMFSTMNIFQNEIH